MSLSLWSELGESRVGAHREEPARDRRLAKILLQDRRCWEPAHYPPCPHGLGEALEVMHAQVTTLEETAEEPAGAQTDDDCIRLGQGLQPGRQVRRFAHHRLLPRRPLPDQVDHQSRGNPDPALRFDVGARRKALTAVTRASPAWTARSAPSSRASG
jgi:hypothetical protein